MLNHNLDDLDRRILDAVQDSKITDYRTLAKAVDAKKSTVYNRVQQLRESGLLKKQFGQLNLEKLNFSGAAVLGLIITPNFLEEAVQYLNNQNQVFMLGRTLGKYDLTLVVITPTIALLGEFIDKHIKTLEGIDKEQMFVSTFHKIERFAEKIHIPE